VAGEQPAVAEWRSTLTLCRRLRWVQELGGWSVSGLSRELTAATVARAQEEKERGVGEERGEGLGLDTHFLDSKWVFFIFGGLERPPKITS
jgi:hypothetical protein